MLGVKTLAQGWYLFFLPNVCVVWTSVNSGLCLKHHLLGEAFLDFLVLVLCIFTLPFFHLHFTYYQLPIKYVHVFNFLFWKVARIYKIEKRIQYHGSLCVHTWASTIINPGPVSYTPTFVASKKLKILHNLLCKLDFKYICLLEDSFQGTWGNSVVPSTVPGS